MLPFTLPTLEDNPLANAFEDAEPAQQRRVLLMCPPFQMLKQASLSIATLATLLRSEGQYCAEAHVHFDFARCFGEATYKHVVNLQTGLASELIFAEALHDLAASPEVARQLTEIYGPKAQRSAQLDQYAELCLEHVRRAQPDIVGCTTSFNQLMASLWLCGLIKHQFPNVMCILGGATCAEPMAQSILKGYPQVDLVVSGFGELPLLWLAKGRRPRSRLVVCDAMPAFDALPIPDFTQTLAQAGAFANAEFKLSYESSRGCWWGQKNHCSFCGLNGNEMRFVAKSSARVVKEIRTLWDRHHMDLCATDNILALEHLHQAMAELGQFEHGPNLLYEIKTNITQKDVAVLRQARVRDLQPGIESLSTHLLQLLKKGTTTIRNLALLKWCREYGIGVWWNLLCCIPGESFEDYDQQLLLLDGIPHLQPPMSCNALRIDRFSPYFKHYADYGFEGLVPFEQYAWHHPHLDAAARYDIAYHFEGRGGLQPGPYLKRMRAAVDEWRERYQRNEGLFYDPERGLVRNLADQGLTYGKNPVLERVLEATHDIAPIEAVMQAAHCNRASIDKLVKSQVLYAENGKVINLAIRAHIARGLSQELPALRTEPPI